MMYFKLRKEYEPGDIVDVTMGSTTRVRLIRRRKIPRSVMFAEFLAEKVPAGTPIKFQKRD